VEETRDQKMECPDPTSGCKRDASFELERQIPTSPEELDLTQRQGAVLVLLMEGLSNKAIAQRLGLTVNSVKENVSAILNHLGLPTRTQVIAKLDHLRVHETIVGVSAHAHRTAFPEDDPFLAPDQRRPVTAAELGLTQRQGSVLALMLEGLSNKSIALRLGLGTETVKQHVSQIYKRLGLRTRAQVISRMKHLRVQHAVSQETGGTH